MADINLEDLKELYKSILEFKDETNQFRNDLTINIKDLGYKVSSLKEDTDKLNNTVEGLRILIVGNGKIGLLERVNNLDKTLAFYSKIGCWVAGIIGAVITALATKII